VYSVGSNPFHLYVMAIFAVVGYLLVKLDCEPAPLLLGFVLGPMLEENLRRAMLLSKGSFSTFIERPISATLLGLSVVALVLVLLPAIRAKREEAFHEP
jgi:TctA family transporter